MRIRLFRLPVAVLAILLAWSAVGVKARQKPLLRAFQAPDLVERLRHAPHAPTRMLVRGNVPAILEAAKRLRVTVHRTLDDFVVVSADAAQAAALGLEPAIAALNGDHVVSVAASVSDRTMAADQARAGTPGLLGIGGYKGVTGRGIGVAVVDSGIAAHDALAGKVAANISFVPDDPSADDGFGHGTHIAGIIAGLPPSGRNLTSAYAGGIARGAHLINVRVLGDEGLGLTSTVIAGIDWVIANRKRYNIRVVNLSLGHTVDAPCAFDPLCSSMQRLVAAGIIPVVSAGNRGKAPTGQQVLGGITSPGNSPFAITAGALNTWNTVGRDDDSVASYSSRGPTAFDFAVKPDVVAPGNKIVSLEASGSYLSRNYPSNHVAGSGRNAFSMMSGTSMSAAMVSGGVALLAEAFPSLSATHAKYLLQTTASFMAKDGLMASGAGSVNIWGARRAGGTTLLSLLPTSLVNGLLVKPGGAAFRDTGTLQTRLFQGSGVKLLGLVEAITALLLPDALAWDKLHLVGHNNPIGDSSPNQILWGERLYDSRGQQILWGDQILWGEQVFDSEGQQILWGDQILWGEQIFWGESFQGEGQ